MRYQFLICSKIRILWSIGDNIWREGYWWWFQRLAALHHSCSVSSLSQMSQKWTHHSSRGVCSIWNTMIWYVYLKIGLQLLGWTTGVSPRCVQFGSSGSHGIYIPILTSDILSYPHRLLAHDHLQKVGITKLNHHLQKMMLVHDQPRKSSPFSKKNNNTLWSGCDVVTF